ncbi:MAG TPA: hypothetical protein VMS04_15530 [Vicinamibacterales bacterium]|jgi:hypothetical protein|nr:hypothetical protein [Vicinamibacterales bacterium]
MADNHEDERSRMQGLAAWLVWFALFVAAIGALVVMWLGRD